MQAMQMSALNNLKRGTVLPLGVCSITQIYREKAWQMGEVRQAIPGW